MNFITEGAVNATAFGFLVETAVDKSAAISNALERFLIIFLPRFLAVFDTLLKKSCNLSATTVLSETILVLDLLQKLH